MRDFQGHRDAWARILEHLSEGDRIVLGRISEETYTHFRPVADRELPVFHALTDNKLDYEEKVRAVRKELAEAIDKALASERSPRTDVMNTLLVAAQIFGGDPRRRVLVLLSDMLEDSSEYSFEKQRITAPFIAKAIDARRQRKALADLGGATVYVAGASAVTAAKAQEVQRFWVDYIAASNGRLAPQNYGPALVNFNE